MAELWKKIGKFVRKNKRALIGVGAFFGLLVFVGALVAGYYIIKSNINTPGLIFELDEETDTYIVTGYEGDSKTVVISGNYQGKKISAIGNRAFMESKITQVTVNGVEKINDQAFIGCEELQILTLRGVKSIGKYAFSGTISLKEIILPDTLESLGSYAFVNGSKVTRIRFPDSLKVIPDHCFADCNKLKKIVWPSALEEIGDRAFEMCYGLTTLDLSGCKNLKRIGEFAFATTSAYSPKFTTVRLPESLEELGDGVFMNNKKLESINLPSKLTAIPSFIFYECQALTSLQIPSGVRSIGESAFFRCLNLQIVTLPETLDSVGGRAFFRNPWRQNYVREDGFAIVANCLVGYFGEEKNLVLPTEGYQFICELIDGVSNTEIETVVIPSGSAKTITRMAIIEATSLKSVVIEDGVEVIEDNNFYACGALQYVSLPKTIKTLDAELFSGTGLVEKDFAVIYYAGSRSEWKNISVSEDNPILLKMKIYFNQTGPEAAA